MPKDDEKLTKEQLIKKNYRFEQRQHRENEVPDSFDEAGLAYPDEEGSQRRALLIVDDNIINRRILVKLLSDEYELSEAENGAEALEIMRNKASELSAVLLDIVMPVMNGYELLDIIRVDPRLSQIPVIVTTGSAQEDSEVKVLAAGANDYVTKPYNPAVIKHRIRNTIKLRETSAAINAARYDDLTGLYNRAAFFERSAAMIARHESGYYVMASFDIDDFKMVNDRYGSVTGDEVLQHIASVFNNGFARLGGICSRITADNFAVLYPSAYMDSEAVAHIRDYASVPPDSALLPITFRIGRYIVTDKTLTVSSMYDRAVMAEESAKGRYGDNIAVFSESMFQNIIRDREIVSEMNTALETGQFEVWLQPQYNHANGAMLGAEALARWRHPKKGLIPPGVFISVFERNGFVYELDKYVWKYCCMLLRKWIEEGRTPLPLSVNISRCDILRDDLYDVLTGYIESFGIPAKLLRLEITESAFAKSTDLIVSVMQRLQEYGFLIEIDDFGSGYSSLNTLKDVPADILKLDMRFLEGNANTERGGNIVQSVIRMAKWLDMPVIAEGVETAAQADYLLSIGCSSIQGYLYAKPMPSAEYEALSCVAPGEFASVSPVRADKAYNNAFWNPESIETLIFNSYTGGACIFEYCNGKTELLRINEKYAHMIGGDAMTIEEALAFDFSAHLSSGDRVAVSDAINTAASTDVESTVELRLNDVPGRPDGVYLSVTLKKIARAGDNIMLYGAIRDITQRRRAELHTAEAAEQLRFLNSMAHDLLAQPDPDIGINGLLHRILSYFGGARAYIFEFTSGRQIINNTYEICGEGVSVEIGNLQNIPASAVAYWTEKFKTGNYIRIEEVELLGEGREDEKRILSDQGISSLIAVPIRRDGELIGFCGVDDPAIQLKHIANLEALGDYIAVMLTRRDLNAALTEESKKLSDILGGNNG